MSKPLIGVTAGEIVNKLQTWSPVTYGQSHTYTDSVIRAGGIPIIIPLTTDVDVLTDICSRLDGLLLSGGNDVSPESYGEEPYPETIETSELRDATDLHVLRTILAANKPVFGICRGLQVLNIHFGGTLYQDIKKDLPAAMDHQLSSKEKDITHLAHPITIDQDSKLGAILGDTTVLTNTHHHQAVKQLGSGLRITATSSDGIVEAIETTDDRFIIGVQSHPESLGVVAPIWSNVFEAFIQQAQLTR